VTKGAVYNENDPGACNVLRELIANNLIAPGDVDERSIKDVRADDYRGYTQVHCFAGAGLWSGALRAAGWPDERPIGSGSCPCQGFSLAGKGLGFDDPRHLYPDWLRLIDEASEQGQPWTSTLFIEQVASAGEWLDLVQSTMEDRGFAFGYADLPAAGFAQGAHIRQRFYGVADRHNAERWSDMAGRHFGDWPQAGRIEGYGQPGAGLASGGVADMHRSERSARNTVSRRASEDGSRGTESSRGSASSGMVHADMQRQRSANHAQGSGDTSRVGQDCGLGHHHHQGPPLGSLCPDERGAIRVEGPAAGASGSLLGCDWLLCHDAKIRPVESGTFPLAPSSPGRLGALRIFGNGLDFETAVNFISAYMEAESDMELI
jgi:DNA (cytosine-5)-methyltransferase 1